jgi:hypothetical protein
MPFVVEARIESSTFLPLSLTLYQLNPFTAEVAIMRLLGSAPKSHLCDQRRRSKVTGLSDLKTLFIDLGCWYCKQTQRAFNVFKNTLNWLKIDSVYQKFYWLECGNFSQDAGTPGTERVIAFSQLAVKGLIAYPARPQKQRSPRPQLQLDWECNTYILISKNRLPNSWSQPLGCRFMKSAKFNVTR